MVSFTRHSFTGPGMNRGSTTSLAIAIVTVLSCHGSWLSLHTSVTRAAEAGEGAAPPPRLPARWQHSAPLIAPERRREEPSRAQKDPTLVYHDGRWHVFMTVKLPGRSAIEYCSFESWDKADAAKRTLLPISDSKYFCAAQVFYFKPHKKWYLVYQMGVPGRKKMWVAYSTTATIADPLSWTKARPMLDGGAEDPRTVGGLDYWIICDDQRAYLFFTSLNGKMWRMWTKLDDFPRGFKHCEVALQARVFEASHTYTLQGAKPGQPRYLTVIEENGRRYFKAYVADRLDGKWTPIANTAQKPFAGEANIQPAPGVEPWTDNISHGELIRAGNDQTLPIDPDNLRFVFQGMLDKHKRGKDYGAWQWRIGMLSPVGSATKRHGDLEVTLRVAPGEANRKRPIAKRLIEVLLANRGEKEIKLDRLYLNRIIAIDVFNESGKRMTTYPPPTPGPFNKARVVVIRPGTTAIDSFRLSDSSIEKYDGARYTVTWQYAPSPDYPAGSGMWQDTIKGLAIEATR